ncbi:ABC transporter permease subunit [Nitriliruptor alkaliphilus]|uniref:ABC transporter permease subunit n=1 Tax=Nitriliruptor alkaliphilus TaxID=427918 RepID=UPI000698B41C|nr:ABC transporter permease subunit [Nitriliruptor alkaliphilus]
MSAMFGVRELAGFELRGAARTRWLSVGGAIFAAAALAVTLAGLRSLSALGLAGAGAATDGLVHLSLLLPPLIGLLLGAGSLARDRERGMLAMLASQPVRRGVLPLAAFAGSVGAVWIVLAAGLGVALVVLSTVATAADLYAFGVVLGVGLLATASAVAIGVAISAIASTHHQATAAAASVWLLLALGMDLLLAGVAPGLRLGPAGLLAAVVLNPLEAARIWALLVLEGGTALGPFGAYLTDRFGVRGTHGVLAAVMTAWTVGPLLVARRVTARRDV